MWLQFLKSYDEKTYFFSQAGQLTRSFNSIQTMPLAKEWGAGHILAANGVFFGWPSTWSDLGILRDITFLELVPVVLSVAIWGNQLQNKKVCFTLIILL